MQLAGSMTALCRAVRRIILLAALLAALPAAHPAAAQSPSEVPCAACIVLTAAPGQSLLVDGPLNGIEILIRVPADAAAVRAAVERIRNMGGRPGLWVTEPGDWLSSEQVVVPLLTRLVFDVTGETTSVEALAFALKQRIVEARGAGARQVGVVARPELLADGLAGDLAAYLDFQAHPTSARPSFPPSAPASAAAAIIRPPSAQSAEAGGPEGWILELPGDALAARSLLADVAASAPSVTSALVAGGMADIRCAGHRVPTYLDTSTLDTVAIADCREPSLQVSPELPGTSRVVLSTGHVVVRVPSVEGRYAEGVQVVGARALDVREIIARHQAAAARQRRAVRQLISTGSMALTFEAPGFPAPLAITSQAVIYTEPDRVEIEQRDIRVNGMSFQSDGAIPRLPLIEPERVASPPLAITLTEMYRYRLAGEDTVRGVRCYVVAFEPSDDSRASFAGRAWIAADGFALVRISAVQTGLRGPIVSSEQTDEFRAVHDAWLLARSEIRQIYEGAAHRTPIHRVVEIARHEINPPDFEARRTAAYDSPSIMLRDTSEGFRYLTRAKPEEGSRALAEPEVASAATEVRTFAFGVILDPNITRPLPFAGLSYVDFDLFGTGTQFNGFFGGTFGQLAVSVPSLGGTRWQLGGRAFGIASSYNDRAFEEGQEIYAWNISQRPAHASVWLIRPVTPRISLRAGYDFDYTRFDEADTTAPTFVVPASQVAHGFRLAVEGQWGGWTGSLWWTGVRRAGWREWGETAPGHQGEEYDSSQHDFQRVGAGVARSFVASPRLVGRLEAAWMSGKDLDRFSRYTFGTFDNRLRGYPSALVRYDSGGVFRSVIAWAAGRRLRLDGFVDTARVRDAGFGGRFRSYTGVGAAAEAPAPFGVLAAVEWGYGFQGITSEGQKGTHVVRISFYKIF